MHQIPLWRFLRHIGRLSRPLGRCWHTHRYSTSTHNPGQVEQTHGVVGSSISWLPLRPLTPNLVWRFLRHIGTFLDNLWGVAHACRQSASAHNWATAHQIHGEWGAQYLSILLRPYGPNCFWTFLQHIGTFLDHLQGVDTLAGRVPVS